MAQFEVFRSEDDDGLLLDCQSDLLRHLNTRLVVPLLPLDRAPRPAARLNPQFEIEGRLLSMVTQFAGAVPARKLGRPLCSLEDRRYDITNALDFLFGTG